MCVVLFLLSQLKRFHRDIINELEKKTEMDVKYMNVSVVCVQERPLLLIRVITFWLMEAHLQITWEKCHPLLCFPTGHL